MGFKSTLYKIVKGEGVLEATPHMGGDIGFSKHAIDVRKKRRNSQKPRPLLWAGNQRVFQRQQFSIGGRHVRQEGEA